MRFIVNFVVKLAERQINVPDGLLKHGGVLEFEGFGTKAYVTILGED
jgi:hypothetical protein